MRAPIELLENESGKLARRRKGNMSIKKTLKKRAPAALIREMIFMCLLTISEMIGRERRGARIKVVAHRGGDLAATFEINSVVVASFTMSESILI